MRSGTGRRGAWAFLASTALLAALLVPLEGVALAVHGNACLDVTPEAGVAEIGLETMTFTATMRAPGTTTCNGALQPASEATRVSFELTGPNDPDGGYSPASPDLNCTIPVNQSSCQVSYAGASTGTDTLTAWIDHDGLSGAQGGDTESDPTEAPETQDLDGTDVVTGEWIHDPPATIDCDDQFGPDREDELRPTDGGINGTHVNYACRVRNAAGQPLRNDTTVYAEVVNGVNDPDQVDGASYEQNDISCTAFGTRHGGSSACAIQYSAVEQEAGTALLCFWAGTAAAGAGHCADEEVYEAAAADGSDEPNDGGDSTRVRFEHRVGTSVDLEDEMDWNDFGQQHNVRATVYDQFGDLMVGSTTVRFELFAGSPADSDGNTPGTADGTCTTANASFCFFSYTETDTEGTDLVCGWLSGTPALAGTADGGTCDGEGPADPDDSPGIADKPEPVDDDVDLVRKAWADPAGATRVDCTPEDDTNPPGTAHTVTCVVTDSSGGPAGGAQVDVEATRANDPDASDSPATPDFSCTTGAGGTCTFTHGPGGSGTTSSLDETIYRAWLDDDGSNATVEADASERRDEGLHPGARPEPDVTDVVTKLWGGPRPASIDVVPETDVHPVGQPRTATATVYDAQGQPSAGNVVVKFELFAGSPSDTDLNTPETPDFTCTTASSATCSITYTNNGPGGSDLMCAWAGDDPAMSGSNVDNGACGGQVGIPDQPGQRVDVFSHWWQGEYGNVDCDDPNAPAETENVASASGPVTYRCSLSFGSGGVAGAVLKGEVISPVNDPDATDGASFASPDYSCTTASDGTCLIEVRQADGEVGTTTICFWHSTAPQGETFCASEPVDETEQGDSADSVSLTWQQTAAVASSIDVEPESATNALGQPHTLSVRVYDQFGNPYHGNTQVRFEWFTGSPSDFDGNSPGTPDRSCTTVNNLQCSFTYTQANSAGTDVFCAWIGGTPPMSGTNATASCEGEGLGDADDDPGAFDVPAPAGDDVDLVAQTWQSSGSVPATVDCDDSNPPITEDENKPSLAGAASNETYTCRVADAGGNALAGVLVNGEVTTSVNDPDATDGASYGSPDYGCTTGAGGTCQIVVTQNENEPGTAFVCFWSGDAGACGSEPYEEALDANRSDTGNDLADAVRVEWHTRVATGLDVEPETATNELGTTHVLTAVVYDQFGQRFTGNTQVKFELFAGSPSDFNGNSPEVPDRSCTTSSNSQCAFGYTQANASGTDVFCAWIGAAPAMSGTNAAPVCAGETLTDADDDPSVPDAPAPAGDRVDLVSKTWSKPKPGPATVDCDDSNPPITEDENKPSGGGSASNETYSCRVADAAGGGVSDVLVKAEVLNGVNDPDATDGSSFASFDYACTTGVDGTCLITVTQNEAEAATAFVCFYAGDASQGEGACASEPYDEAVDANRSDTGNDLADAVRIEWHVRRAAGVDLEPESSAGPLGTTHVVTAVVYDQFGDRFVGSTQVKLEWFTGSPSDFNGNSPATPDRSCTTVNNSQCSFGYTQANATGTDLFCAWIGADPVMSGSNLNGTCDGEGLGDPDDAAGTPDPPEPRSDRIDLISRTWQAAAT